MVVYGVRKQREKSMGKIKEWLYHQFYVLFSYTSYIKIPQDAGDFSVMDRVVVDHINALPERDRFIRGLRAWVGYKSAGINYKRPERFDGRQSVSTKGLLSAFRWARKAIFSFSYKPLELVTYMAILTSAISLLGVLFYVITFFIKGAPAGFATLVVIVLFLSSVQLVAISVIGEYITKIFEEIKGRPRFIIRDVVNDHRKN
jgi:dolichol-phosphate mannosyltransferase